MNILMIGNAPEVRGGITSVIDQLKAHDWEKRGIKIRFVPSFAGGNNLKKILYFGKALCKVMIKILLNKPDIVYMHMSHHGSFDRKNTIHKICRLSGIPDVIHLHGSEFQVWYDSCSAQKQGKIRAFLRKCGALIVLGEKWDQKIKMIEPLTNTIVINNTVHIPSERAQWRNDSVNILFLGVLVKRKGVSDLLDAAALLKNQNRLGNMRFIISGSGEEENALQAKARELSVEDYITFTGWTDGEKKKRLFYESQMMVLPSYNEGLPIAVLEAISYGLPVVATNVGDLASAVVDGYNGYLVEPGDVSSLADRLALLSNPEKNREFAAHSRELACKYFSDEQYFEALAATFRGLGKA